MTTWIAVNSLNGGNNSGWLFINIEENSDISKEESFIRGDISKEYFVKEYTSSEFYIQGDISNEYFVTNILCDIFIVTG